MVESLKEELANPEVKASLMVVVVVVVVMGRVMMVVGRVAIKSFNKQCTSNRLSVFSTGLRKS